MAFIFFLYVRESFRKEGIGKAATVQLKNILQKQTIQRIQLNVFAKNKAKYLYEEPGFTIVSYGMQKWIKSEKQCNETDEIVSIISCWATNK